MKKWMPFCFAMMLLPMMAIADQLVITGTSDQPTVIFLENGHARPRVAESIGPKVFSIGDHVLKDENSDFHIIFNFAGGHSFCYVDGSNNAHWTGHYKRTAFQQILSVTVHKKGSPTTSSFYCKQD